MSRRIESLNEKQERFWHQALDERLVLMKDATSIDRQQYLATVGSLCDAMQRRCPMVIFCDSPFQTALASLLVGPFEPENQGVLVSMLTPFVLANNNSEVRVQLEAMLSQLIKLPQHTAHSAELMEQFRSNVLPQFQGITLDELRGLKMEQSIFADFEKESSTAFIGTGESLMIRLDSVLERRLKARFNTPYWRLPIAPIRGELARFIWYCVSGNVRSEPVSVSMDSSMPIFALWSKAATLAYDHFGQRLLDLPANRICESWDQLISQTHAIFARGSLCFVSDRPQKIFLDAEGRLHNANGPALVYRDGFKIYAWRGAVIEWRHSNLIEAPTTVGVEQIRETRNIEIRRLALERFGLARYIKESGARIIHQDIDPATGHARTLYRQEFQNDEPLVMVAVINSTPEDDGTFKEYLLRVPPQIETTQEAVAWTFGISSDDYFPTEQS